MNLTHKLQDTFLFRNHGVQLCFDSDLFLRVTCEVYCGVARILMKAFLCMRPHTSVEGCPPHRALLLSNRYHAFPVLSTTLGMKSASILSRKETFPRTVSLQRCI